MKQRYTLERMRNDILHDFADLAEEMGMDEAVEELREVAGEDMRETVLDRKVTVCDACLQASCWQHIFCCDRYKTAGTRELTVSQLRELSGENPEYWFKSPHTGAIDQQALAEYLARVEALT